MDRRGRRSLQGFGVYRSFSGRRGADPYKGLVYTARSRQEVNERLKHYQRLPPGVSWILRSKRLKENALQRNQTKLKVTQAPSTATAVPLPPGGRL